MSDINNYNREPYHSVILSNKIELIFFTWLNILIPTLQKQVTKPTIPANSVDVQRITKKFTSVTLTEMDWMRFCVATCKLSTNKSLDSSVKLTLYCRSKVLFYTRFNHKSNGTVSRYMRYDWFLKFVELNKDTP